MTHARRVAVVAVCALVPVIAVGSPAHSAVAARSAPVRSAPVRSPARSARLLIVAPNGSDRAAGTAAAPLRSIALAVRRLRSGGTIELRGGHYHQRVKLNRVHNLTLRPYRREHPVIDGSGLRPPSDISALIEIAGSDNVTVRGLDISGYRSSRLSAVPAGIWVHSHDRAITIRDNHVHNLGNDNGTLGSFGINAHGIAVYGDDPHTSITALSIRNNTVDHLRLGASETIVVNGNVNHWSITGNHVRDVNNIGIVAIGYEQTLSGRYRYTTRNRARNGLIADNVVSRVRSRGNPAYWQGTGNGADGEWCNCADGIYVDGGTHIRIRDNHVGDSDIGIEVAAENARGSADHVTVTHNHITGSLLTGLSTGGYCNGAAGCGGVQTGASHDNLFEYNYLRANNQLNDGSPEVSIQYHVYRDTFRHNTITTANSGHVVYGTVPRADSDGHPGTVHSDDNRFRVTGGSRRTIEFGWQGRTYESFARYRRSTGQDAHSSVG